MMRLSKYTIILTVSILILSTVPADVLAQAGDGALQETAVEITVGEILAIAASFTAVVATACMAAYMMATGRISGAGADAMVARRLNDFATNPDSIAPIENILNKVSEDARANMRDVATLIMIATAWVPGESPEALAKLINEAADGIALEKKLQWGAAPAGVDPEQAVSPGADITHASGQTFYGGGGVDAVPDSPSEPESPPPVADDPPAPV